MTRKRVLIVDDSDISLKQLRSLAEHESVDTLEFFEADSGEAGLALVEREGPFSYALVDVHLPGISGFKMLKEMRSRDPDSYAQMQVFMMCSDGPDTDHSHEESHDHSDACESLYQSWLFKPIDIELMRRYLVSDARMRSLIDQNKGTKLHHDSLRTLFEDAHHLTEKQIRALEYLVNSLTEDQSE